MTISIYERSMAADQEAVRVLTDGPMAWLAELDLLDIAGEGPRRPEPGELGKIREAMMDRERTGSWYNPNRYVLCAPYSVEPNTWTLLYWAPSPHGDEWRKVTAEVDRW